MDALFGAVWTAGGSIDDAGRVAAVLDRAGFDGAALVGRASSPEAKDRLRRNTDEAVGRGAFGVPSMFVGGEMFFGFESFADLEGFLRGDDPVARHPDMVSRWSDLPASATRPRSRRTP